jgi:hypothetical protein
MKKVNAYYLTENDSENTYAVPELRYEATAKEVRDDPKYWAWTHLNGACSNPLGGVCFGREEDVLRAIRD